MPASSSSPIERVALPADISDSVSYLQSFMHSHSSSTGPAAGASDYGGWREPARSSWTRREEDPPRSAAARDATWPAASSRWGGTEERERRDWPRSTRGGGFSAAAAISPLRSRTPLEDRSGFRWGTRSRATPLRYGWQHMSSRGGSFASQDASATPFSQSWSLGAGAAAFPAWERDVSRDAAERDRRWGGAHRPSPLHSRHHDVESLREDVPPRGPSYATTGAPRETGQTRRTLGSSPPPRDRFAAHPAAASSLPPRAPSSSSRPPSSVSAPSLTQSAQGEEEEAARGYEVVIDVDDAEDVSEDDLSDARPSPRTPAAAASTRDAERVSPRRRAPDPPLPRRDTSPPPPPPPPPVTQLPHGDDHGEDKRKPASPSHSPLRRTRFLAQQSHDENVKDVACYLKDYYACDPAETDQGLETMEPEDVLGLVQCFYVDLYRVVRTLRSSLNLPIHMFSDGDPTQALVIPAATGTYAASANAIRKAEVEAEDLEDVSEVSAPYARPQAGPVQRIQAKIPAFTRPSAATTSAPTTSTHNSAAVNTSVASRGSYQSGGLAATRALSPEQALAGSPSPPYRTSAPRPQSPRSTTTTPQRRRPEEKRQALPDAAPPARRRRAETSSKAKAGASSIVSSSSLSASTSRSASTADPRTDPPQPPIAKRPLKALMPHLRTGAYILKHNSSLRAPHLRWFQVQDCVDSFHGRDVLMPHFTWADSQAEASKLTSDTAYNLVGLESVAIGAGKSAEDKAWKLFKRKKGRVVNDKGQFIATGLCVVLQFQGKKPIGLSFQSEETRQIWVGALMGVVERNRSIANKT